MGVIHGVNWDFYFDDGPLMFFGANGEIVTVEEEEADAPTIVERSPMNGDKE